MNKIILIGKLGQDPTTRYTKTGQAVCNFSIATNKKFKNTSGEMEEKVSWHQCVAWAKLGELCQTYLAKGRQCMVEGELEYNKYTDKNGMEKIATNIVCSNVEFLDKGGVEKTPGVQDTPAVRTTPARQVDNHARYGGSNYGNTNHINQQTKPKESEQWDSTDIPF